jgi:hypothetical protein
MHSNALRKVRDRTLDIGEIADAIDELGNRAVGSQGELWTAGALLRRLAGMLEADGADRFLISESHSRSLKLTEELT